MTTRFDSERLASDPFLIVGWRSGKSITCRRMPIEKKLHENIREIVQKYMMVLADSTPRDYEPSAALEQGEQYFTVPIDAVPKLADKQGEREASLISELKSVSDLPSVENDELSSQRLLFYGFTFQQPDLTKWMSFIRKTNPTTYFHSSRYWCTANEVLKTVETSPTFAFDETFDLIFDDDMIYASASVPLKQLFTEVNLYATNVGSYVADFVSRLPPEIDIPDESINQIVELAKRKTSLVSRIHGLTARLQEISQFKDISAATFLEAIDDEEAGNAIIIESKIQLDSDANVETFLDAVEGRFYRDGWTSERRRADRYSSRK